MTKFLFGRNILTDIAEALRATKTADFAVAFWGAGAVNVLKLNTLTSARILCDAYSGSCNPNELEAILQLGFPIKTIRGLHSKVYLLPSVAIVGSANASANGLGNEGAESMNEEAAVSFREAALVYDVQKWFEDLWKKGTDVAFGDLHCIRKTWALRQASRYTNELSEIVPKDDAANSIEPQRAAVVTETQSEQKHDDTYESPEFVDAPLDQRCEFLLHYFKSKSLNEMRRDQVNELLKSEFGVAHADLAWVTRALSTKRLIFPSKQAPGLVRLTEAGQRFLRSI